MEAPVLESETQGSDGLPIWFHSSRGGDDLLAGLAVTGVGGVAEEGKGRSGSRKVGEEGVGLHRLCVSVTTQYSPTWTISEGLVFAF
ncbi:hypothetical protein F2Q70_00001482 [Brassica cretica]|uniref:Uncharacterized protein n=1 Tax=Brassica cretica TaxID=69181 RepID=A0A8S9IN22_BRACR|nr:hypothetical protein F2Q70_00001482 [Brassica cretica]